MRLGLEIAATGLILVTSVYVVAVLDLVLGRLVAAAPLHLAEAVVRPVRRGALLFLQRPPRTERPDQALWILAPALLGAIAAAVLFVMPLGPTELSPSSGMRDVDAGIVYFGALMALVMVAVYLHGWAPNSLFPMVGGYRFVALALSYEMPLALVLIGAALPARSLSISAIVDAQAGLWNLVRQPLGLPLYLVAALGLTFRGPLNVPDATDLAGGTRAESSGAGLLLWELGRNAVLVAAAAMGAAAFLGGWRGPFLPGPLWMAAKSLALVAVLLGVSHLIGRVRLERFVVVAWAVLIPLALLDVFAAGTVALLAGRP